MAMRHLRTFAGPRVRETAGGIAIIAAAVATPFLRLRRSHWGTDPTTAAACFPGDQLVPLPRWQWTHAIEIEAGPSTVWPWVAQIGADRGGFYSYELLENAVGCRLRNAETIHGEWQHRVGDDLLIHPKASPLRVVEVEDGRCLVAYGAPDPDTARWTAATWAFMIDPLDDTRCRLFSRYRCATSDDLGSRLLMGPTFLEPISFAMDRQMLRTIKSRAERPAS